MGVQITTDERFNEIFKDYTVLAGEIEQSGGGIVITDYVADSILKFRSDEYSDYQSIVNGGYIAGRVDVDAIIKTDIYERFPNFLDNWDSFEDNVSLLLQLTTTYSYGYSLNPNFKNYFLNEYKQYDSKFIHIPNYHFTNSKGKQLNSTSAGVSFDSSLKDNELHLNYATYNSYFGGKFNTKNLDTFEGDVFTVKIYDVKSDTIIEKNFEVTKLYVKEHYYDTFHISTSHYDNLYSNLTYSFAISVDTSEGSCYEMIKAHYYAESVDEEDKEEEEFERYDWAIMNSEVHLMFATVELFSTFKGVFKFLSYLLIGAIFLIVILNSNTLIKHNVYEIGLMKAFGAKTKDLVMMFAAQMFFSSLIVCMLLYSSSSIVIELADNLLKKGILTYMGSISEKSFTFSSFVFLDGYFYLNIALIAVSTITSVIVPIVAIRKIKPLTIIRTRN